MGCVSSKLIRKQVREEEEKSSASSSFFKNNGCGGAGGGGRREGGVNHVVSLTSTTYGALKLDTGHREFDPDEEVKQEPIKEVVEESKKKTMEEPIKEVVAEIKKVEVQSPVKEFVGTEIKKSKNGSSPGREEPAEVINAWELMEGLEEDPGLEAENKSKKFRSPCPKPKALLVDARTPLKFLNHFGSPRKAKTFGGKENKVKRPHPDFSPRPVLKPINSPRSYCKAVLKLSYPVKGTPVGAKTDGFGNDSAVSSRRRSFSPLFDPELVALYEKELSEEEETIKRIVTSTPVPQKWRNPKELESFLQSFEQKCPPGGANAVVIYTTTLRGIRKTFEDCNTVRSIAESHHIHVLERDVSMDSGFKEELRGLMGSKEVKVPLVFVKGRLIGGADQVVKLEEEGKLGVLFDGIPKGLASGCEGCAGVRFVMCVECNGSCKVLDEAEKKMVRCGLCNENGLIHCPICCC